MTHANTLKSGTCFAAPRAERQNNWQQLKCVRPRLLLTLDSLGPDKRPLTSKHGSTWQTVVENSETNLQLSKEPQGHVEFQCLVAVRRRVLWSPQTEARKVTNRPNYSPTTMTDAPLLAFLSSTWFKPTRQRVETHPATRLPSKATRAGAVQIFGPKTSERPTGEAKRSEARSDGFQPRSVLAPFVAMPGAPSGQEPLVASLLLVASCYW